MINIALCFENDTELSFLHMELSRCFDLRGIDYNIYCYHNTAELRRGIRRKCPDLFFYDIMGEYGLIRMAALSIKEMNPKLVSVIYQNRNYIKPPNDILLEPLYTIPNKSRKQLWTYAFLAYEATLDKENAFSYYKRPSYLHAPYDSIKYFVSEGRRTRIVSTEGEHNNAFYKKLNEECDVRFPYPNEQDWEWCAGDYIYTNDYIEFYKFYATVIDDWQKHLLINMIVQGIEDFMEQTEDEGYIDMLWSKVKEILINDKHRDTIVYWSCIGQELEDCWLISSNMRELL